MKMRYFFENEDADHCYTEAYFQQKMKEEGLEEMTVLEANKSKDKDYIYCTEIDACGEASSCGKECEDYEPRNGKNGCCRSRRTIYEHGEEVTLSLTNIKKQGELRQYECSLDKKHWMSFNATSPGQAKNKFKYYLDMDVDYLMVKCRVVGAVYTSDEFIRNAKYRGIEFAYCGMVVTVDGIKGIIVGHNESANLNILFTEGEYKGQTLNCHPNWKMTYFDKSGAIIKAF